jgi:hypothetical protein
LCQKPIKIPKKPVSKTHVSSEKNMCEKPTSIQEKPKNFCQKPSYIEEKPQKTCDKTLHQ